MKKYKNLRAIAVEFEKAFKGNIVTEIDKLAIYKNLESHSDKVLSELAWQYSIDNWQENLPREVKKNLIKNAYWGHAKKGTKIAVMENLKKLDTPIDIKEWFEYGGDPFTFKISSFYPKTENDWIGNLIEIVEKYKNCRSICTEYEMKLLEKNSKLKMGSFKVLNFDKEYITYSGNRTRNNKIRNGSFKIIEMEVIKNV